MSRHSSLSVLVVACALTYVSPIRTPFDTQPYALIVSVFIVAGHLGTPLVQRLPTLVLLPFLTLITAVASWLASGSTLTGARSLAGYATFALAALAAYCNASERLGRLIPLLSGIYVAAAVAQTIISKELFAALLPRLATSGGRGVTSLAPEPSIFAIACVMLMCLNEWSFQREEYGRPTYTATWAALTLGIALAASALGAMVLLTYLLSRAVVLRHVGQMVWTGLFATFVGAVGYLTFTRLEALQHSRMSSLMVQASSRPSDLLLSDQSIAERAFAIHASFASLDQGHVFGYGLGQWAESLPLIVARNPELLRYQVSTIGQGRIMSAIGTALFELGLGGVLIPTTIVVALAVAWRANGASARWAAAACLTVVAVMVTSMPLAFPFFGLIFGLAVRASRRPSHPDSLGLSHEMRLESSPSYG